MHPARIQCTKKASELLQYHKDTQKAYENFFLELAMQYFGLQLTR